VTGLHLIDFPQRRFTAELMDAPDCDEQRLRQSYVELAAINRWLSRAPSLLDRYVLADLPALTRGAPQRTIRVVDAGCGGGDVLAWLHRRAQALHLDLDLIGVDRDPRAVRFARERHGERPGLRFVEGSLYDLATIAPPADYVFCNHVLHHFADRDVPAVLASLFAATGRRLLINDLARSRLSYLAFTLLAALACRKSYTFHDGRLSIQKGFQEGELVAAAQRAQLPRPLVATCAPGRIFLVADVVPRAT
jgi:SAM-dependent methyltransferase